MNTRLESVAERELGPTAEMVANIVAAVVDHLERSGCCDECVDIADRALEATLDAKPGDDRRNAV